MVILMIAWYCHLLQSQIYGGGLRILKMSLNPFDKVIHLTLFTQMHPYRDGELFFGDNHQEATGDLIKLVSILIALN